MIIVVFIVFLAFGSSQRLDAMPEIYYVCDKYLAKLGTVNQNGFLPTKLAFTGDIYFITESNDVTVNLRYSDVDLFNDSKYFGLVKEDGKPYNETCLDLVLYQFKSNDYSDAVKITDLPITPSSNFEKKWRYYSFTIPGSQLATRLVETKNSNYILYTGYYILAYYAAGTDQIQYKFYFDFSLSINRNSEGVAAFTPFSRLATVECTVDSCCSTKADTDLKWCSNSTCQQYETPDLHYNDQFYMQQVVTSSYMEIYYLIDTQIWYIGEGLLKQAQPISINNITPGQVIIQLIADVAWNNIIIQVTSVLSSTITGESTILAQTTFDTILGKSEQLVCIKAEGQNICPTCEQQCKANGFAQNGCEPCQSSILNYMEFVFLAILLAFII